MSFNTLQLSFAALSTLPVAPFDLHPASSVPLLYQLPHFGASLGTTIGKVVNASAALMAEL